MSDNSNFDLGAAFGDLVSGTDNPGAGIADAGGSFLGGVGAGLGAMTANVMPGWGPSWGYGGYGYGGYGGYGYGRYSNGSSLLGSIFGALLGIALLVASFWLIYWNENKATHLSDQTSSHFSRVVELDPNTVTAVSGDHLVHIAGWVEGSATPHDPLFNIEMPQALTLHRKVEMYQWQETFANPQGNAPLYAKTDATASYAKGWSEALVDSRHFRYGVGHENPAGFPVITLAANTPAGRANQAGESIASATFDAPEVTMGSYKIGPELRQQMKETVPVTIDASPRIQGFYLDGNSTIYHGSNSKDPKVGDLRITFEAVPAQEYTVIGALNGTELTGFHNGTTIAVVKPGIDSTKSLLHKTPHKTDKATWIYRGLGFLGVFLSFLLIAGPATWLVSWIPLLGGLAEAGIFFAALTFAVPVTLGAIGLAWIGQRPLLTAVIIILGGGIGFALWRRHVIEEQHAAKVQAYMATRQAAHSDHADRDAESFRF